MANSTTQQGTQRLGYCPSWPQTGSPLQLHNCPFPSSHIPHHMGSHGVNQIPQGALEFMPLKSSKALDTKKIAPADRCDISFMELHKIRLPECCCHIDDYYTSLSHWTWDEFRSLGLRCYQQHANDP